jgi:hypothetical protein
MKAKRALAAGEVRVGRWRSQSEAPGRKRGLEIETQGALTDVAPGDTLVWTVRWKLRQLVGGTSVAVGSSGLRSFSSVELGQ